MPLWVEFVGGPRDGEVWPFSDPHPRIYVEQLPLLNNLVGNVTGVPLLRPEPLVYERRRSDRLRRMVADPEFPVRYDLVR